MALYASPYGWYYPLADTEVLPYDKYAAMSADIRNFLMQSLEVVGPGFFSSQDFVISGNVGAQTVTFTGGRAITGITAALNLVYGAAPVTLGVADGIVGSGGGTTNYFHLKPDGTWHVDQVNTIPSGGLLAGTCSMGSVQALSVNSNPTGRRNSWDYPPGPPTVSAAAEVSNARIVTIQAADMRGNPVLGVRKLSIIVADAAFGTECATAPTGGLTFTTGVVIKQNTTNKNVDVWTDVNGLVVFSVGETGVKTFYINAIAGANPTSFALAFV